MARPLTKYADDELDELLERTSDHVSHSYNGIVAEMERRDTNRTAAVNARLARTAIIIATLSLVVSAMGIVVQAAK